MLNGIQTRQLGLVVTEAVGDLLIYDQESHQLHSLNRLAASVWRHLDSCETLDSLADKVYSDLDQPVSGEALRMAVSQLSEAGLIVGDLRLERARTTRRKTLKQAGLGVVVPTVVSVTATTSAQAVSCYKSALCGMTPGDTSMIGLPCCSGIAPYPICARIDDSYNSCVPADRCGQPGVYCG